MPGFDRTGPLGQGSLTGRGLGPCGGGVAYGRGFGRGFGRGLGFGRPARQSLGVGRSYGFGYRQPTKSEEVADTKAYLEDLKAEVKDVQDYLKDLETKN